MVKIEKKPFTVLLGKSFSSILFVNPTNEEIEFIRVQLEKTISADVEALLTEAKIKKLHKEFIESKKAGSS